MTIVKPEMQTTLANNVNSSAFSSLYVGDLSPDVTEEDLISKFTLTGPVVSAHLCRDSITGKSLCYAYVNFDSPNSASNAMACLNHTDLNGKAMRIMWRQKDIADRRRSGIGNLFVKNLDSSITSICLERMFGVFGTILSCKVVVENGQSKGFGFVQFDTEQSAVAARSALHGTTVDGKKLFVAKFINKSERVAKTGNQDFTNVYVKNLSENVTDEALLKLFSQYGTVSNAEVMRDGMGRSKGFGFVDFCRSEHAKKAVESLNGQKPFGSKALFVGKALRKAERLEMLKQKHGDKVFAKFNLYVRNLSDAIDKTRLEEIFGSYGKIVSAIVMRHENGRSKGFGFVGYSTLEESKQAKRNLDGFFVDGKPLFVRVAERKEDRFKRMQQYFHGQPRHYMQARPVPPPQPVPTSVPSPYGYCHPVHIGPSYYYMGNQLQPQMLGHQNISAYYVTTGKDQKTAVPYFYKHQVYYPFAKQKVDFPGECNKNLKAATCSKETTSAEDKNKKATSVKRASVTIRHPK